MPPATKRIYNIHTGGIFVSGWKCVLKHSDINVHSFEMKSKSKRNGRRDAPATFSKRPTLSLSLSPTFQVKDENEIYFAHDHTHTDEHTHTLAQWWRPLAMNKPHARASDLCQNAQTRKAYTNIAFGRLVDSFMRLVSANRTYAYAVVRLNYWKSDRFNGTAFRAG